MGADAIEFSLFQWKKLVSRFFKTNDDAKMSHEELLLFMQDVEQDGGIDENEGELLRNALEFRDLTAAEILTHRIDLEAVDIEAKAMRKLPEPLRSPAFPVCWSTGIRISRSSAFFIRRTSISTAR